MDDSYIYKTWVVFSFKNNDLHSSVCKLMFRGKSLQYVTTQKIAVILYSQHSVYDIVHNFISMQSPIIDIFGLNVGTYKNTIRTIV